MKWLLLISSVACWSLLATATPDRPGGPTSPHQPSAQDRFFDLKSHKKRGVPSFSHGIDIPIIKHSIIKPFIVQYPVQSIPIGVKIPLKNPNLQKNPPGHKPVGSGSKFPHFHVHHPVHLPPVKPGWPTNNCNHGQPTQPEQIPVLPPPPPTPIIPTGSVNIPVNIVPSPPLTPVLPLARPPIPFLVKPLLHPPVFGPVPFAPAPLTPIPIATAPLAPIAPVAPAAVFPSVHVPSVIRPGHSIHTSYSATFPRHPFINAVPAITPHIPLVGAPAAAYPVNIGRFPVNLGHVPINVAKFPIGVAPPPLFAHQIPVGNAQIPIGPPFAGSAQIPLQSSFGAAQNPIFFQRPGIQYPVQTLSPEGPQIFPGNQDQGTNGNPIQGLGPADNNVWTPMASPTPDNIFPTIQYPPQVTPQDETQFQPQGTTEQNTEQNPGYVYRPNGNQPFEDGQNIQESLRQQAQNQFLNAQQFFGQQQQQLQEQQQQDRLNQDDSQNAIQQQYLQEQQQQFLDQQQFDAAQQQEQDVQQFSQQQFITGDQLAAANPQHDPQFPQALPNHHLSGSSINQAFKINHRRRRQKKRSKASENQNK